MPPINAVGTLIADPTGPIHVEHRTADLLETAPVARDQVLSDTSYVAATEWQEARERAANALVESSVLLLVAPRHHGSTTFSFRLLAEETDEEVDLHVVETSWNHPLASKLPAQAKSAYVLDLQDSDRDRINRTFLSHLEKYEQTLNKNGSYLIITVTPEIWSHVAGQVPAWLKVVRLSNYPRALEVARKHLSAHGHTSLLEYLNDTTVQENITDWSPVRAVRLVDEMIALRGEITREAADEGVDPSSYEDHLQSEIQELAGGWGEILNIRFADSTKISTLPSTESDTTVQVLDVDDRCLSLALAVRHSGPMSQIQDDAQRLSDILAGVNSTSLEKSADKKRSVDLKAVLAGVGLRTRLNTIGADVHYGEAQFDSPNYGEALLIHVWDQYHPLHERLIRWMVSCGGEGSTADDPAVQAILNVLAHHQDDSQLTKVRDEAAALDRLSVATAVLVGAARDEHLGRRARDFLYAWSDNKTSETQQLVVAACRELIEDQPGPALIRLRRVADNAANSQVSNDILNAFNAAAANPKLTGWFSNAVSEWQSQAGKASSPAVNLGVLALMSVDEDGLPWLLKGAGPKPDVASALRELLADLDNYPDVINAIIRWLRADDGSIYYHVLGLVQEAVADRVGLKALAQLINELGKVRERGGSSAGTQLQDSIGADPDLGVLPLGDPTA
ncbi:hypothetical protein [Streptomyces sp. yr375]|uniref:hypothetical protein n=1 Tax=Streptomyces sp. yr375 TaxID=1761906 RepID=UPI0015A659B7|nr:hypothetical protein [Streptomyces sp. yr375]